MIRARTGLLMILIASLITGAHGATLHGTIYEWSDFENPLKNAILEVNSTPAQYVVATTGTYSFNLSTGTYRLTARYYRNNVLDFITEEIIVVDSEGDFIHDLLLFPPTDSEYEYLGDINLSNDIDIKNDDDLTNIIIILISLISISAVFLWIKHRKAKPRETTPHPVLSENRNAKELPEDIRDLYEIILKTGGRITQKDLRKNTKWSEAKISLMLDDLEDRGFIKKIKKGRSNIIIAEVVNHAGLKA